MRISCTHLIALAAAAGCEAAPAPANVERQLIDLEKGSWVAWQNHDAAYFRRFLSADHIEMGPQGPAPKEPIVKMIGSGMCTVRSYALDSFKVTMFSPTTALLTYRADQDTTCGTMKVPTPSWANSLFMKRNGRWENVLYGHTAIPAGTPRQQPAQ